VGSRTGHNTDSEVFAPEVRPKSILREYVETFLICIIFVLFARCFVCLQSEIPTGSMEDTLLVGDFLLVNRFLYAPTSFEIEKKLLPTREVRRGEIVVFKHPPQPEIDFIKRVIALPGETVEIRRGRPLIDGRPLDEPYINELYRLADSYGPVEVPAGQYFVMGDHRNSSRDSREWGFVPAELIKGRAFMILASTGAPPDPAEPPGKVTLKSLPRKLWNLAFKSRWDRALQPIR
jgi:signal peptidase I